MPGEFFCVLYSIKSLSLNIHDLCSIIINFSFRFIEGMFMHVKWVSVVVNFTVVAYLSLKKKLVPHCPDKRGCTLYEKEDVTQ